MMSQEHPGCMFLCQVVSQELPAYTGSNRFKLLPQGNSTAAANVSVIGWQPQRISTQFKL